MRFDTSLVSLAVLAIGTAALSACGDSKESVQPKAGRWEAEFKIVKMDMPGMPPELKGMLDAQIGKVETSVSCLTKEEAEKAEENLFRPPNTEGDECKFDKFEVADGKIEGEMKCEKGNQKQDMKLTGTYGPEAYSMNVVADGEQAGQKVSVEMEISSKRVGECDGSEKG